MIFNQILDFSEPQFKTWTSDNFLMSTILSQETAYDWFMNYYVNTLGIIRTGSIQSSPSVLFHPIGLPTTSQFLVNIWDLCPFINKNTLNREILSISNKMTSDFIVDYLSQGYFICVSLGQSKIRKKHSSHTTYIIGFDKILGNLYLVDHIDHGRFKIFTMNFDDFNYAYSEATEYISLMDKDHQMEANSIYLIKPKKFKYKFDINLLLKFIEDYRNSDSGVGFISRINNTPYRKEKFCYGMSMYDIIEDYLENLLETYSKTNIDYRIFTFLCDHKSIMCKRVEYLIDKGYLQPSDTIIMDAKENENYAKKCLNLIMKFSCNNKKKELEKTILYLKQLKQKDQFFLENITDNIYKF